MAKREYKQRTPDETVAILRLVLVEKQPVSEVCDEHGLSPTGFYECQRLFFRERSVGLRQGRGFREARPHEEGRGAGGEACQEGRGHR